MEKTSTKLQFDAALGGDVEIPSSIKVQSLVQARMNEIEALTKLIETPSSSITFKQKFPKHLRRRAMGQNIKRFPKRLREGQSEKREKSGIREVALKRPRRKYRRRPSNLLFEYNRRQREHIWLETHIWHAKRFHMVEKWGYKLPLHPNDKSYRACYRASSKHCLIQDISYYCCIELSGKLEKLLNGLNLHCNSDCGLTFNASYKQSGCSEGYVFFYQAHNYPKGAIGEVKYLWRPPKADSERTIWLWCHPSFYNEVIKELVRTFSFTLQENMVVGTNQNGDGGDTNVEITKLKPRNYPFIKTQKYSSSDNSVQMVILKDALNRFCLTGPLSNALITQAFQHVDVEKRTLKDWVTGYVDDVGLNTCRKQLEFWQKLKNFSSPGQLPKHFIFSAVVVDPRFTLPTGRKKAEENIKEPGVLLDPDPELCMSALWCSEVRDEVTRSKMSTHQINEMRSDKVVPGLEIEAKDSSFHNLPAIPVLFIQEPGEDNGLKPLGYGSGWDIIVPSGYGVPVWLALNLHGGRAGGLKERANVYRERGRIMFPPDTASGKIHEEILEEAETKKYFGLPPAKRQNYIKLGVPTPFQCPWEALMNDWTGSTSYYILRDRRKLLLIKNKLRDVAQDISLYGDNLELLIPVIIELKGKGTLLRSSHICIPSPEDLQKLCEENDFSGPTEMPYKDHLEATRNKSRSDHKTLLKRLARQRRKAKKNKKPVTPFISENIIAEQKNTMRDLWMPSCETIKNFSSRTIFGFICEADFSFTSSKTVGIGYVTFAGLIEFFKVLSTVEKPNHLILVRNINTRQYRFGKIDIIL